MNGDAFLTSDATGRSSLSFLSPFGHGFLIPHTSVSGNSSKGFSYMLWSPSAYFTDQVSRIKT